MPQSGPLPPSATPSVLPFMTVSRLASEKREAFSSLVSGLQAAPGCCARLPALLKQVMTNRGVCRRAPRSDERCSRHRALFDLWEQNIETVRALIGATRSTGHCPCLVGHLRACAIALVKRASNAAHPASRNGMRPKIDKSVLTISEPKRIRSKEHLRFVASQPCLICGRSPSQAHHVRYAQSRGLSLKVSDEFTVPLCATHHHHIHTTGKGTGVVAGAQYRSAQSRECSVATKSRATSISARS